MPALERRRLKGVQTYPDTNTVDDSRAQFEQPLMWYGVVLRPYTFI